MSERVKAEVVLNDDCTAVTITLRDIPLEILARTLETLGNPSMVEQFVAGVHDRIPLTKAGEPETRKVLKIL